MKDEVALNHWRVEVRSFNVQSGGACRMKEIQDIEYSRAKLRQFSEYTLSENAGKLDQWHIYS